MPDSSHYSTDPPTESTLESVFFRPFIRKREQLAKNVGVKVENVNILGEKTTFWVDEQKKGKVVRIFCWEIGNFFGWNLKFLRPDLRPPRLQTRLTPLCVWACVCDEMRGWLMSGDCNAANCATRAVYDVLWPLGPTLSASVPLFGSLCPSASISEMISSRSLGRDERLKKLETFKQTL